MSGPQPLPRVLIVGGGFAGLAAAKALAGAPVEVTLIDRRNHHVFQPLLYQVATASLSPADISAPIRTVLRGQANCQVALAEVTGVDVAGRRLLVDGRPRRLRLPRPRRRRDARLLRPRRVGPDRAGPEDPRGRHRAAPAHPAGLRVGRVRGQRRAPGARSLTFGIVGGGPTGVELAGAIKEIAGPDPPARLQAHRHADDPRHPLRGRRPRAAAVPAGAERAGAARPGAHGRRGAPELDR